MGLSLLFHVYKIVDIKECEIIFIYFCYFISLFSHIQLFKTSSFLFLKLRTFNT